MRNLFLSTPLAQLPNAWSVPGLFSYGFAVFCLMQLSLLTPVPLGVFLPLMAVGATLGRATGEILAAAGVAEVVSPASFAVVGGCALAAGSTHAISTAVLVAELTGDVSLLPGVVLATLSAIGVANKLSSSIYESQSLAANLPHFPVASSLSLHKVVGDIMGRTGSYSFIAAQCTLDELRSVRWLPLCCCTGRVRVVWSGVNAVDLPTCRFFYFSCPCLTRSLFVFLRSPRRSSKRHRAKMLLS